MWRLDTGQHYRMYPACFPILPPGIPVDFKRTPGLPGGTVAGNRSEEEHTEAPADPSTHTKTRGFVEYTAASSCLQPGCVSTDRQ